MEFQRIWSKVVSHEGEQFYTKTKLPFTYRIIGDCVVPDRTNYPLGKSEFEKAVMLSPLKGPGQLNELVRGPSYIFAILTDERIR